MKKSVFRASHNEEKHVSETRENENTEVLEKETVKHTRRNRKRDNNE